MDYSATVLKLSGLSFCLILQACSLLPFDPLDALAQKQLNAIDPPHSSSPLTWQAPLPHQGQVVHLTEWWEQLHDPILVRLIAAAEQVSASIVTAQAHIEDARANYTNAKGNLLPSLEASTTGYRGLQSLFFPAATIGSIGAASNWEIDLFGKNQAALSAALARFNGAAANWHAARVSIAAEVANAYINLRSCEAQTIKLEQDVGSKLQTARLTEELTRVGLEAPASSVLANAISAESKNSLLQQQTQCGLQVKALVALTDIAESQLRQLLRAKSAQFPEIQAFNIESVPATAIAQRPDIYTAGYEVLAASADITQIDANKYPKIAFSGNISLTHMELATGPIGGMVWSVGPIAITLPLFDGGRRVANVTSAKAKYEAAIAVYQEKVRTAVREVEAALLTLHHNSQRLTAIEAAVKNYHSHLLATQSLYKSGLASTLELENAQRMDLQAQMALIETRRSQVGAWIALYRAVGGGWTPEDNQKI